MFFYELCVCLHPLFFFVSLLVCFVYISAYRKTGARPFFFSFISSFLFLLWYVFCRFVHVLKPVHAFQSLSLPNTPCIIIVLSEFTMDPLDRHCRMNSPTCAHMLFEESSSDHGFDAYMDKIVESDAYLTRTNHPSDPNGLLRHYLSFVAFWLQPENRQFVTNNLFSIYLGQSGFAILRDDCHSFEKAQMCFNKAILIKSIYVNYIDDYRHIPRILYALEEFGSKTAMVHYIHHYVPCHCFDELSTHYPIDGENLIST